MGIPIPIRFITKNTQHSTIDHVSCPHCRKNTRYVLVKKETVSKVMFIPVAKTVHATYALCAECGAAYEIFKNDLRTIHNNQDVINAIMHYHNSKTSGKIDDGLKKEQKKIRMIGIVLSLIGVVGIPITALAGAVEVMMIPAVCATIGFILLARSFLHVKYKSVK